MTRRNQFLKTRVLSGVIILK